MVESTKIPVISIHPRSVGAHTIFNPNAWEDESRTIALSCAAEYSMLDYTVNRIKVICGNPDSQCRPYFQDLAALWTKAPWDLSKCNHFGEVPELHLLVEGFFSGTKSLLDIVVQLLSTEGIVTAQVHGFHKCGERILRALTRNTPAQMKQHAEKFIEFLKAEKVKWIDKAIGIRDLLIHPKNGVGMLMFRLEVESLKGKLNYKGAESPAIDSIAVPEFCEDFLSKISNFCVSFLALFPDERGDRP